MVKGKGKASRERGSNKKLKKQETSGGKGLTKGRERARQVQTGWDRYRSRGGKVKREEDVCVRISEE